MSAATAPAAAARQPALFLPHGGGPWPFVEMGLPMIEVDLLRRFFTGLPARLPARPSAVLVISAHWEAAVPTVMTAATPSLSFDYYGFPAASYQVEWPAPGAPALAARVNALLESAGIPSAADGERGFDHGVFVPLKLVWPTDAPPTVQLSLQRGLDPSLHLAIGRALAPLRDEGVLIIGSGMSYHNMRGFGSPTARHGAELFHDWLDALAVGAPGSRGAAPPPRATAPHPRRRPPPPKAQQHRNVG